MGFVEHSIIKKPSETCLSYERHLLVNHGALISENELKSYFQGQDLIFYKHAEDVPKERATVKGTISTDGPVLYINQCPFAKKLGMTNLYECKNPHGVPPFCIEKIRLG